MRGGMQIPYNLIKEGLILAMCNDSKILNSEVLLLHVPII